MGWLSKDDRLKDDMAATIAGDAPREPAAGSGVHRPTVLLADDNADMREYVSGLLARRVPT